MSEVRQGQSRAPGFTSRLVSIGWKLGLAVVVVVTTAMAVAFFHFTAREKAGLVDAKQKAAEMVAVLKRQQFNGAIPAGLPPGTVVAHKTGTITRIHHDAAIVFGPKPFVLVVLVRGIQDQKVSAPLIASISRAAS